MERKKERKKEEKERKEREKRKKERKERKKKAISEFRSCHCHCGTLRELLES